MVIGTTAMVGTPTAGTQIAGNVGVGVTVAVMLAVAELVEVCVGALVRVNVRVAVGGSVGAGIVGVAVGAMAVAVAVELGGTTGVRLGVRVAVAGGGTAQPLDVHASQQLMNCPTHAVPPRGAVHFDASRFTEHVVLPLELVRQHVTAPARPQMDFIAHRVTWREQTFGKPPAATASLTT